MSYYYLAIDFGESNIGLSVSNGFLSQPLKVFKYPRNNYQILKEYLIRIINENKVSVVIIGVPFSNEKNTSKIKNIFLSFIFEEEEFKKKIVWVNEDYSTKEAILLKKRKKKREDSIAASIFLENYFLMLD